MSPKFTIHAHIRRKRRGEDYWLRGQKRCHLPGGEAGREGQGGEEKKKKRGEKKVDLPVAQLLAAHSRYYLLRLESPVSQGRTAEEAKYVTGDRQVSDRAGRSVGISASEGKFVFASVLSTPTPSTPYLKFTDFFKKKSRSPGIVSDIEK